MTIKFDLNRPHHLSCHLIKSSQHIIIISSPRLHHLPNHLHHLHLHHLHLHIQFPHPAEHQAPEQLIFIFKGRLRLSATSSSPSIVSNGSKLTHLPTIKNVSTPSILFESQRLRFQVETIYRFILERAGNFMVNITFNPKVI